MRSPWWRPPTPPPWRACWRFCNEHRIGVVPQGGNTSYCGGATPDASSSQVLLSLARLNRVRAIDAANYTMTAEAGCILATLQAAAAEADRYLPLSLGQRRQLHAGRQSLHQRRRTQRHPLRHGARAGAGPRSGAGRRPRAGHAHRACARTTPATTSSRCSWAPKARSASSPPPASSCIPALRSRATAFVAVRDPGRRRVVVRRAARRRAATA